MLIYNNPITYKDPDGTIPIETVWDAANVALGVGSLVSNIRQGNVGAAVIDGVGVIFDAAATVLPYIPGSVGTTIKSYRASKGLVKVGEAAAKAEKITKPVSSSKVSKAVNTSKATSKPKVTRRAAFRQAKRDAGIPTSQTHKRGDAAKNKNSGRRGIEYEYDAQGSYGTQQTKYVQDHYEGHTYLDGSVDNTPHFNIHQRPKSQKNDNNHYPYTPKKKK